MSEISERAAEIEAARRAVIEAAREWRHGVRTTGEEQSTHALSMAVDRLDEVDPE